MNPLSLGNWTIWSLNDGYLDLDQRCFVGIEPAAIREQLKDARAQCIRDFVIRTQVNGYLIDTGSQLILIDTGCGACGRPGTGLLVSRLQHLGYDPRQISLVLITHCDFDHIGGLLAVDGSLVFPEATVCVSAVEVNYWFSSPEETRAKADRHSCFALAKRILGPYKNAGKLRLIQSEETILPGIRAMAAFGHTPGHMAYLLNSNHAQLLLWGDIVHSQEIQFAHPNWLIMDDSDGKLAADSRKRLFALAADQHLLVGGAHLPYSGLGYVSRTEKAFAWHPLLP